MDGLLFVGKQESGAGAGCVIDLDKVAMTSSSKFMPSVDIAG